MHRSQLVEDNEQILQSKSSGTPEAPQLAGTAAVGAETIPSRITYSKNELIDIAEVHSSVIDCMIANLLVGGWVLAFPS